MKTQRNDDENTIADICNTCYNYRCTEKYLINVQYFVAKAKTYLYCIGV